MIEFNAYVRNPPAPRILVNNIGGVYRLDGGIIQVTFAWQFRDPNFNTVEQGSLIWPKANWHLRVHAALGAGRNHPRKRSAAHPAAQAALSELRRHCGGSAAWNKCPYAVVRYV